MKKRKLLKGAAIGVILGTVAGYLFNPKKGEANRKKVKTVSKKLIGRLQTEVMGVKNLTKGSYNALIKKVMADFKEDKALSKESWDDVSEALKERWSDISQDIKESKDKTVAKAKSKLVKKKTTKKS